MIENCPETDIEFDAPRFTSAHELRRAECFCSGQCSTIFYRTR
jgi:hypothetical protein